jgi:hypothetical protein
MDDQRDVLERICDVRVALFVELFWLRLEPALFRLCKAVAA